MSHPIRFKNQVKRAVALPSASSSTVRPRTVREVVDLCGMLNGHGIPCTIGKFSPAGDDPAGVVREYREASDHLSGASFYLSVKPPALGFAVNHAAAITATAIRNGHGVHFDSHRISDADETLQLLREVMERYPAPGDPNRPWRYGLTLPSRWKRSMDDARWAAEKGVRVRLVKGEFKAGSEEEVEPRSGFLALVDQLCGRVAEVVVATEDHALAREAVYRLRRGGTAVQLENISALRPDPSPASRGKNRSRWVSTSRTGKRFWSMPCIIFSKTPTSCSGPHFTAGSFSAIGQSLPALWPARSSHLCRLLQVPLKWGPLTSLLLSRHLVHPFQQGWQTVGAWHRANNTFARPTSIPTAVTYSGLQLFPL